MTGLIQKIKCTISSGSIAEYYNRLGKDELEERKKGLKKMLLAPLIAWLTSFFLVTLSADLDLPLLIAFSLAVFGTIILDYRTNDKEAYLDRYYSCVNGLGILGV